MRPLYAQQARDRQLVQTGSTSASNNKRIALVIGNGVYTNAPQLKNPPNDATDMADTLSRLGFNVEHGVNLTQRQMKAMIREFGQKLRRNGGQGLFYFAGHGVQLRGRNYLIPVDAEILSETDVEDQGVDANLVMGLMDEAGNGLNVVILDACRNNPFARSFRSAANGLAQVDAPTGTLIAYATSPGRVARDGTGRNGAYTAELLRQMRVPGLGIEELLKRVRANLKQQTNGEQVPWEASSLVGNFYLNAVADTTPATDSSTVGVAGANATPAAVEQEFWDSIKSSTDAEDFRTYLKEYPTGLHVVIARNNLRRLEAASKNNNAGRNGTDSNTAAGNRNNPAAISPSRPSARELIQRSNGLWRSCDYDQAINVATEAINSSPRSSEAYTARGAAYLFKLEFDHALSDLNQAISLQPDNALALRWRVMTYRGLVVQNASWSGKTEAFTSMASKDAEAILRLIVNPKEAWEYEARGYVYYQSEKYDLAISDLDQAIRLDPQYLPAYV
ncbi:MAG: caspase family protein, partial [Acidobacteria bacterium]|nr:caspase family protein [Acidobacteriota bacterium]